MMTNKTDYYSILQLSSEATAEEIKRSFRRLARKYHPDLNPDNPETADQFKQISEAYDTLSDRTRRRRYDRDRKLNNNQSKRNSRSSRSTTTTSYTSSTRQEPNPENRNAQEFFLRGIEKSKSKQYQKAANEYSKAIELDPSFIDAYLKRCEMRYKLGDNQGVLDDCYRVIQISSTVPKAYYYQGRARFSLGYTQAAIDSYSEAIRQEQNYAQAYYYRGIAYQDVKDNSLAIEDWQVAAELFRTEGNYGAYRLTKKKISTLNKGIFNLGFTFSLLGDVLNNALTTLIAYLFNPSGGLLPAFTRLSPSQAIGVGLIYGIAADLCLTGSDYLLVGTPDRFISPSNTVSFWQIIAINFFPFMGLVLLSSLVSAIAQVRGNWGKDIFLAGTSILPLALSFLLMGFIASPQGIPILPRLTLLIFGFSYAILTLYVNCTQILRLSDTKATFLAPLMTTVSLGFHHLSKFLFV